MWLCLIGFRLTRTHAQEETCQPGTFCGMEPMAEVSFSSSTGGFSVVAQETGKITLSINGIGHDGVASIGVRKPSGVATVRAAFLFASRIYASTVIPVVSLNSSPVTWVGQATSPSVALSSFYADVTSIVKTLLDSAVAGEILVPVEELSGTSGITDGEILAVIFDDPEQELENSASLLFGALSSAGDSFTINLVSPITPADLSDPNRLRLSLGIGFSYQSNQFSTIVS